MLLYYSVIIVLLNLSPGHGDPHPGLLQGHRRGDQARRQTDGGGGGVCAGI